LQVKGETSSQYLETVEGLAITLQHQKKYSESLALFEKQKAFCVKKFGNKSSKTALAITNLADFYASQEKLQQAEAAYNEAITMLKNNESQENPEENPEYATILAKLGNLYEAMFLFQNSIKPYEECLKIRRSVLGEESEEYLETLNDLATVYQKLRLYEKAEPYFREYIAALNTEIVNHFPALNDAEKAAYYSTNQPYFENFMRYALDRSGMNPYNVVQGSRTSPKVLGDLYNLQLSTKAILLSSSSNVRNKILSSKDTALINAYRRWISYKEQIGQYKNFKKADLATLGVNLDSLETTANSLERNLTLQSTAFAQGYTKINLPTWEDIQKKLQPNEAAIEIISLPYKKDTTVYIALIIKPETQNQPEAVVLGKGKEMDNPFLKTYRNSIKYKIIDKQTYNNYWKPIAEKLQGITKVYVSPDGAYHQINLNTLWNPNTGQYLIDEISVVLLTNTKDILQHDTKAIVMSLSDLEKTKKQPFGVLVGRPAYHINNAPPHPLTTRVRGGTMDLMRGVNFTDLLGTELEIVQIDSSLKAINFQTKFYTKHEASELLMKNLAGLSPNGQSPTILHIATHGFFLNNSENLSDPMLRSGIALAGINDYLQDGDKYQGEDGIVKASEIILMDLSNTEIVGLSACETGLGEIKNGEGVYGLQRALKVAGAKAILMSLWKVDDTATQLLMSSFYAAYTTHDKRTAFRMAQQKLKEKYKEPFYWGAFVMIGE
jgi:CHAT domain-containing protein